jgi:hypothetical protein
MRVINGKKKLFKFLWVVMPCIVVVACQCFGRTMLPPYPGDGLESSLPLKPQTSQNICYYTVQITSIHTPKKLINV